MWFYKTVKKQSSVQLKDDFLDFPPAPLRCQGIDSSFNMVSIRGVGEAWYGVAIVLKIISAKDRDIEPGLCDDEFVNELSAASKDFKEQVSQVLDGFARLDVARKALTAVVLIVASPLIFLAFLFFASRALVAFFRVSRERATSGKGKLGFFLPVVQGDNEIVIRPTQIKKARASLRSVVSHEHIHLLQHLDARRNGVRDLEKMTVLHPHRLLSEEWCDNRHLLYALEKNELEARLHEVVISYYREHRSIPLDIHGFLSLMAGCEEIAYLVVDALRDNGCGESSFHEGCGFKVGQGTFIGDMELILLTIISSEKRAEFVLEVLPVMYANLLRYYGDRVRSDEFMAQIQRPNLYDELYERDVGSCPTASGDLEGSGLLP